MSKRCSKEIGHGMKRKVFYISLVAADKRGRHRNKYFTFDLMSKMDMENTEVIVLDVHDLVELYKKNHNGKIDLALKLVDIAAKSKANYIKFQTYFTILIANKR